MSVLSGREAAIFTVRLIMKQTKKYRTDLARALRCVEKGKAFHWPTIADILAVEVKRLQEERMSLSTSPS